MIYGVLSVNSNHTEELLSKKQLIEETNQLKEENSKFNSIIQNIENGLISINKDTSITFLNQKARDLFYRFEEIKLLEDSFKHTLYSNNKNKNYSIDDFPFEKMLQGFSIRNIQIRATRPDNVIYFLISCKPIFNCHGAIDSILLELHDNTEKMKNRYKLIQAQRRERASIMAAIKMKDEFLSIISHEFRTPLTVINSAIQMMDIYRNKGEFEKALKYTENIKRNVFRQLRLVNNLLDISKSNAKCLKINKGNYDIVFLTSSMTQFISEYAKQKEVNIIFSTAVKNCFLGIDEEKYERIMLNLLSNAIKFTPSGKNIYVSVFKKNSNIYVQVKDEGIGIPKEKQIIIFKRFGQVDSTLSRSAEGTGIGLSLVKLLIKQLGGSIHLESEENKGSSFTLCFPISTIEEGNSIILPNELNNRFIQTMKIEFSDIYLP